MTYSDVVVKVPFHQPSDNVKRHICACMAHVRLIIHCRPTNIPIDPSAVEGDEFFLCSSVDVAPSAL